MGWTCRICGTDHDELPTTYGTDAPWALMGVEEDELAARVQMNDDVCIVDGEHHFVRGHVELPRASRR